MRQELEETRYIEEFLLGILDSEEIKAFENKLNNDYVFAGKVENQLILMDRIQTFALRKSILSAHKRNVGGKNFHIRYNWIFKFLKPIIILAFATGGYYIWNNSRLADSEKYTIHPPIKGIDVPFQYKKVNSSKASVINFKSGTSLFIPMNAFVDADGNPVNEIVDIKFREFSDDIDIYLAGIPMNYNERGRRYYFESAGMSELYACKNGKNLKIAPGKNIEVVQKSYTSSIAFNLYRFDTLQGRWINKGKDLPTDGIELAIDNIKNLNTSSNSKLPIKPKKAKEYGLQLELKFETEEFPELEGFKGVLFEVDEKASPYKEGDGETIWEDVKITKGNKHGSYKVTLSSETEGKNTSYIVYPVYEGDDYQNAEKLYESRLAQYNKKLAIKEEKKKQRILKLEQERRRVDSINKAIEERNAIRRVEKRRIDSMNAIIIKRNQEIRENQLANNLNYKRQDVLRSRFTKQSVKDKLVFNEVTKENLLKHQDLIEKTWNINRKKEIAQLSTKDKVYRTYQISEFGIWNTDTPSRLPKGKVLNAQFLFEETGNIYEINLIDRKIRSVFKYSEKNYKRFQYNPNSDNAIWTVRGNQILYFNDFDSIPEKSLDFTFNLKAIEGPFETYEEVRKLLEEL